LNTKKKSGDVCRENGLTTHHWVLCLGHRWGGRWFRGAGKQGKAKSHSKKSTTPIIKLRAVRAGLNLNGNGGLLGHWESSAEQKKTVTERMPAGKSKAEKEL